MMRWLREEVTMGRWVAILLWGMLVIKLPSNIEEIVGWFR